MKSFAVVGTPIKQSLSPLIHQTFAEQLGVELHYSAIEIAEVDFEQALLTMMQTLQGINVTVPFKERAYAAADQASAAAHFARAANTLSFTSEGIIADNTDGVGLVRDLIHNIGLSLTGKRLLVLGAGGAVRGCLQALLSEQPSCIQIHNRTRAKAEKVIEEYQQAVGGDQVPLSLLTEMTPEPFDLIINGTSAGLQKQQPDIPDSVYTADTFVYDMLYDRAGSTPCEQWASSRQLRATDGLGMLVEQAAAAFSVWHGTQPETGAVLRALRQ